MIEALRADLLGDEAAHAAREAERFEREFAARPDCGTDVYERRQP